MLLIDFKSPGLIQWEGAKGQSRARREASSAEQCLNCIESGLEKEDNAIPKCAVRQSEIELKKRTEIYPKN